MYGTSACLGPTEAVPVLVGEQEQRLHPCPCPCVGRGACVCVCLRACAEGERVRGDLCSASKSPGSLCPVQTGLVCLFAHSGD